MWTKAGKQALQTVAIWNATANVNTAKPMFPNSSIRNTSNQERWVSYVNGNLFSNLTIVTNANQGIHIGSGITTPTENDYKLGTQITSGFSATSSNAVRGVDLDGKPYMELTYTITNTGSASMTISEMGIVTQNVWCCNTSTATSASTNHVLLDRTLLATPVTIEAGDSAAIKYRITCDMTFT